MQYVRGYFWIGMIVLLWAAVLCGCARIDPRGPSEYRFDYAEEGIKLRVTAEVPAGYFTEPKYKFSFERTPEATKAEATFGMNTENAKGFWGNAISGLVGFLAGLFA